MSTFNYNDYISLVWITTIFLIIRLALRRIVHYYNTKDWEFQTRMKRIRQRPNLITLMKIYSKLSRSTPKEIAINVRDELTGDAAMIFDKSPAYFVRYRKDAEVMKQYFDDKELRLFFRDPKQWSRLNGGVTRSLFGLRTDDTKATEGYIDNINRVLLKFEKEIAGAKSYKAPNKR